MKLTNLRSMFGRWHAVLALLTVALLLTVASGRPSAAGREFYAAPNGSSSNDGSLSRPFDLATALSGSKTAPGDTIWLRGGTYVGTFTSNLTGTASAPITVRQFPGERATIDAKSTTNDALVVNGAYAIYWGFEVTNSSPTRTIGPALTIYGAYTKFINLVVHEGGAQGVGLWTPAVGAELYGSILYNNGFDSPGDRGYGHSLYTQNQTGTKLIADNIMFNSYSFGIHAYTQGGAVDGFDIEGNILFNHGMASSVSGAKSNLLLGGGKVAHNAKIVNNYSYYPRGAGGRGADIGYGTPCADAYVADNYFAGDASINFNCTGSSVVGNQLYGPISSNINLAGSNTIYANRPTGTQVYVRANKYEPGRANIAIYNWDLLPQVSVDLSQVRQADGQPLLTPGQTYEVRDAQNFFGPSVASGVFNGTVIIPMTGLTAVAPIAGHATAHTGPEFGAFVILPLGASTGLAASFGAAPAQVQPGGTSTLSWATNNATSVSIDQGIGAVAASGSRVVNPTATTTFKLTARNDSGTTITRSVTVSVLVPSADGTTSPPASEIVEPNGTVWSLAANNNILRNGVWAAGGLATKLLWQGGQLYAFGTDKTWWVWQASTWSNVGATQPGSGGGGTPSSPSPDGSLLPPLSQLVDANGAVWTLAANQRILQNGVWAGGGLGSKLLYYSGAIYAFGTDSNWWKWQSNAWSKVGPSQPGTTPEPPAGTTSPAGSTLPPLTQLVDGNGATWTLGANGQTLRNGVWSGGGLASKLLWTGSSIYALGQGNVWWEWMNSTSAWTSRGTTQPGSGSTASPSPNGSLAPPLAQLVDDTGAVWTLAPNGDTLRNGTWVGFGIGSKLLWSNGAIYTFGTDLNWWRWQNSSSSWSRVGPNQPGTN